MKRAGAFVFLIVIIAFTSVSAQKKSRRVVDRPYFISARGKLEITKVELTADTTFLDIMIYGRPAEEVNIDTAAVLRCDGDLFPLCGKENLASQGKWVKLSDTGERSARIKFAPLPINAQEFDFVENAEGGWCISGIRLNNVKPEVNVPADLKGQQFVDEDNFPSSELRFGKSIIRGQLLGYRPGSEVTISSSNTSWFVGRGIPPFVPVKDDGTFLIESYIVAPLHTTLYIGGISTPIDVFSLPGSEVEIIIDLPACFMAHSHIRGKDYKGVPYVWFRGDYARLNTEILNNKVLNGIIEGDFFSDICGMNPLQYKKYCWKVLEKKRNAIEKNKGLGVMTRRILLLNLEMSTFNALSEYKSNLGYAPMISGKKGVKRADMTIEADYYDDILKLDCIGKPDVIMGRLFMSYVHHASELFPDKILPQQPLWNDLKLTRKVAWQFGRSLPLNEELRATADSIQSTEILECVNLINNALADKLAESEKKTGFTVLELEEDLDNDQLLKAIVAPFKGKVVLIDFWATWCGPCLRAMKYMAPLKEKYESAGVVFLYVTGVTSPEGNWKNTIPDIKGNHYRLTDNQWNFLMTKYEIPGIPAYFIMDGNGDIAYKSVGFPGTDVLENEFENILNKK